MEDFESEFLPRSLDFLAGDLLVQLPPGVDYVDSDLVLNIVLSAAAAVRTEKLLLNFVTGTDLG